MRRDVTHELSRGGQDVGLVLQWDKYTLQINKPQYKRNTAHTKAHTLKHCNNNVTSL